MTAVSCLLGRELLEGLQLRGRWLVREKPVVGGDDGKCCGPKQRSCCRLL